MTNNLIRIGIFYDGNYFSHASNYYNYEHSRKARLSVSGIHNYIRHYIAQEEGVEKSYCKITDAHYFRGRLNSYDAHQSNRLLSERIFEDILMNEGIVTHYLPLRYIDGKRGEKGIDVYLALEAFDLAIHKSFDVIVLIACDGDYVPLVKKLNSLGVKVAVLAWDFEYVDSRTGKSRETVTSIDLLNESVYPMLIHEVIDSKVKKNELIVDNLFVKQGKQSIVSPQSENTKVEMSKILSLKNGYGFISKPPNNLYFHWTDVDIDFNDLNIGDTVKFISAQNEKGQEIAVDVQLVN